MFAMPSCRQATPASVSVKNALDTVPHCRAQQGEAFQNAARQAEGPHLAAAWRLPRKGLRRQAAPRQEAICPAKPHNHLPIVEHFQPAGRGVEVAVVVQPQVCCTGIKRQISGALGRARLPTCMRCARCGLQWTAMGTGNPLQTAQ